jgi:hypothetical protein
VRPEQTVAALRRISERCAKLLGLGSPEPKTGGHDLKKLSIDELVRLHIFSRKAKVTLSVEPMFLQAG